ncbi:sensor histidine kinase [Cohnella sp.]|uniref:sensor histidine kinase n=1 Tax=Cohnella sp. TaxID=1883426 RepID=UPI003563C0AC
MKWIWDSSIARSILGGFLAFMIPVLVFSVFMNSKSIETARTEITGSYQNSISLLTRQLDDRVSVMSTVVDYMITDTNILYLNYKEEVDANQLFAYAALVDNLKFYANTSLLKGEIRVYLPNKGKSFSSVTGYSDINQADHLEALDLNAKQTGHWRLDERSLIFVRNPLLKRESKGIVAMARIDKSEVVQFLNNLNVANPAGTLFLVDAEGQWLFSEASPHVDKVTLLQKLRELGSDADQFVFGDGGRDYRVIYGKSPSSGLIVGMYFSEQYAMRTITGKIQLMTVFAVVAIMLAMLFTWIVYSRLLRPFYILVESMRKVGKGEFGTRIGLIPEKDFGFVFRHFNKMAGDTEKLINEVYLERLTNQNTQLQLLQSRINPHFLYNCLNFIYQMSMGENHEGAAKMASHLGQYFRFMAKGNREMISLGEECDNVASLLEIQNMRFSGRIVYRIDIPDELRDKRVPSLIVQPLVENAILHGLKPDQERLFIRISASTDEGIFMIVVEDDGRGIPLNRLEEIRRNLQVFDAGGTGIGLNNTYWRLRLKYGDHADLKLENIVPRGLRVTLVLERHLKENTDV